MCNDFLRLDRIQEDLSRKGAKRCRVSKVFLCAFAPLRESLVGSLTLLGPVLALAPR
jgi:hypothetical protein